MILHLSGARPNCTIAAPTRADYRPIDYYSLEAPPPAVNSADIVIGGPLNMLERLKRLFGFSPPTPVLELGGDTVFTGRERRETQRPAAKAGILILVVDDSKTVVSVLRKILQQDGYAVLDAADGAQALEVARNRRPDLIFLDIVMPGMNGFVALRELRRDPVTRDTPVIMISGNEQATEEFYVQRIGADDFMKKPFSRAEVFHRIEGLLDDEGVPRRQGASRAAAG